MDNEYVKIYGKITDFDGNPISGATVRLLSYHFEDVYSTITDDNGKYEMKVEKDLYYAFYACKDYKINYLEYWAWNVPIYDDMELNARINGIEVYALNVFCVQGAYPALSLYFRPMSLIKGKNLDKLGYWDAETKKQKKYTEIFDICPQLSKDDIDVQVDGEKVEVLNVNKVLEYSGKAENGENQYRYAYLLQVSLPQDYKNKRCQYKKIHITLTDRDTGEKGEGSVFWKEEETKMEEKNLFSEKDLFLICRDNRDSENKFGVNKDFIEVSGEDRIDFWSLENKNAKCNLIYFPPNGGNLSFMVHVLHKIMEECSLNVYAFNYRGYGESSGNPTIENVLEDSGQVIEEVYKIADKSMPTILMGYSLGCFTCLNSKKGSEIEIWVKGYVCVSPFSSAEDLGKIFDEAGMNLEMAPEMNRLDNIKPVDKMTAPILFVHGLNDDFIPSFMSEKLYGISSSEYRKILLIEGAGHNDIFNEKYLDKIIKEINALVKNII